MSDAPKNPEFGDTEPDDAVDASDEPEQEQDEDE